MIKEKFKPNTGLTLIEILIGIIVSSIMMAAIYTTYSVVNTTYNQVLEKAKVSRASREPRRDHPLSPTRPHLF